MKYAALIATLLALASAPAVAEDAVVLGQPAYGGSGCPDGTASIVMGFGAQAAIYLFDSYTVGDNGRAVDRKTCGLAIPVHVPAGMSVAVRNVAVRGVANLPEGLDATLNVELFSAGSSGEVNEIPLPGPGRTGYLRFVNVPDDKLVWSECGADINLRVNTSLRSRGDKDGKAELDALIVYPLATKAC